MAFSFAAVVVFVKMPRGLEKQTLESSVHQSPSSRLESQSLNTCSVSYTILLSVCVCVPGRAVLVGTPSWRTAIVLGTRRPCGTVLQ